MKQPGQWLGSFCRNVRELREWLVNIIYIMGNLNAVKEMPLMGTPDRLINP